MKSYLYIFYLCICSLACANTDSRRWATAEGEKFFAELVSYKVETGEVVLKINDKEDVKYHFDDFGIVDKAWLVEWGEQGDLIDAQVAELGGRFEHIVTEGQYPTDLFIYYPSAHTKLAADDAKMPAVILFNAGAKALRHVKQHIHAAEEAGIILIGVGSFRNTGDDDKREAEMLLRFREVFPQIVEGVDFDHDRLFMGGNSGGAWRAFHYSAWVDWPWAGIYSSVGWLGGTKYHDLDYCDDMRVALVIGSNDSNHWLERDIEVLQKHNAEVVVISFEGGHQASPEHIKTKALKWLVEAEEFEVE